MSRRALVLLVCILVGLVGLVALGWLVRGDPVGADAVTEPGTIDPRFRCTASTEPDVLRVGERFRLRLTVVGDVDIGHEGLLRLGFPHPYYALRGVAPTDPYPPRPPGPDAVAAQALGRELPAAVPSLGWGRWHVEVSMTQDVAAGRPIDIDVAELVAPNRAMDGFEPLLLLDPTGQGDFWRVCRDLSLSVEPGPSVGLVHRGAEPRGAG